MLTPLIIAIQHGRIEKVKMLLNAGADPNVTGPNLTTPLMYAITHGHTNIALLLLDSDAELSQKDIAKLDAADYASLTKNLRLLDIIRDKQHRRLLVQNPEPKTVPQDSKKRIA